MSGDDLNTRYNSEYHQPVLLKEVIKNLISRKDGIYVDGTLGGGGHSQAILENISSTAVLIGIDQDDDALRFAKGRLKKFKNFNPVKGNFAQLGEILSQKGVERVDGFLFDIGVSSHQLDLGSRGFAFSSDGPLDMRMDQSNSVDAAQILNSVPEKELADILYQFGEERKSFRVASRIVSERTKNPFEKTGDLKHIIEEFYSGKQLIKALSRIFQALRIYVNNELDVLTKVLKESFMRLETGGRIAVISYHSLEDRIVKNQFKYWESDCVCPPELPVCQCDKKKEVKIFKPFPITPDKDEIVRNNRSRSAKLRVCEKISE